MGDMTMKDRMLAVLRGGQVDRVPFVQYSGLGGPNEDVWGVIGRENMGLLRWCSLHRFEHPHCRFETQAVEHDGLRGQRRALITPSGTLAELRLRTPSLGSLAAREHFVKVPDDYRVLMAYLRDITVVEDLDPVRRAVEELGDDGLPLAAVPRTPYQQLWIEWVCLADLCLHLADEPDLLAECTDLMGRVLRQVFRVVRAAAEKIDLPFIDVPDNITAAAIGRRYFQTYCLPHYDELADLLADAGVPVFVHMDGDLMALQADIAGSRVAGLDSFTPAPDNDMRVAEAVAMWPRMVLLVNFPSSVHLASPEAIYRQARQILDEGGHTGRLWIQVSEDVPPGRWRVSYPPIVRAIGDFGRPRAP